MTAPLAGIRVLDLSQFLSGPRTAQLLAMFGADVVKVEPPAGDTMRMLMTATGAARTMHTMHHGKRGIVVDLRAPGAAELILRLVACADILVENLAPGALENLGLDDDALHAANPGLIIASIRGFGRTGPLSDRLAFDLIAQATGGTMFASHQPDRPPGVFFADLCAGAYAALGILAALRERDRTGRGKVVDISMQDVMYFHNFWAFSHRATEPDRAQIEAILGRSMQGLLADPDDPKPFWNSFRAADGYVAIVALTEKQWRALMAAIGHPEKADEPELANFVGRLRNAKLGIGVINEWTARHTVADIVATLAAAGVPCGPVQDYDDLAADPQLAARGMLAQTSHPRHGDLAVPGFPIKFAGEPEPPAAPGPELGEHTDDVLADWLGFTDDDIAAWRHRKVVM